MDIHGRKNKLFQELLDTVDNKLRKSVVSQDNLFDADTRTFFNQRQINGAEPSKKGKISPCKILHGRSNSEHGIYDDEKTVKRTKNFSVPYISS